MVYADYGINMFAVGESSSVIKAVSAFIRFSGHDTVPVCML